MALDNYGLENNLYLTSETGPLATPVILKNNLSYAVALRRAVVALQ